MECSGTALLFTYLPYAIIHSVSEQVINTFKILVYRLEVEKPHRSKRKWKDNITMNAGETPVLAKVHIRAVVNTIMNFRVP
jgi:hypothetical protein